MHKHSRSRPRNELVDLVDQLIELDCLIHSSDWVDDIPIWTKPNKQLSTQSSDTDDDQPISHLSRGSRSRPIQSSSEESEESDVSSGSDDIQSINPPKNRNKNDPNSRFQSYQTVYNKLSNFISSNSSSNYITPLSIQEYFSLDHLRKLLRANIESINQSLDQSISMDTLRLSKVVLAETLSSFLNHSIDQSISPLDRFIRPENYGKYIAEQSSRKSLSKHSIKQSIKQSVVSSGPRLAKPSINHALSKDEDYAAVYPHLMRSINQTNNQWSNQPNSLLSYLNDLNKDCLILISSVNKVSYFKTSKEDLIDRLADWLSSNQPKPPTIKQLNNQSNNQTFKRYCKLYGTLLSLDWLWLTSVDRLNQHFNPDELSIMASVNGISDNKSNNHSRKQSTNPANDLAKRVLNLIINNTILRPNEITVDYLNLLE